MAHPPSSATPPRPPSGTPRSFPSLPASGPEDFPGCLPFHFPAADLERHEVRLEFWDGRTETAWMVPDTPIWHEAPRCRLAGLTADLEMLRGSEIMCLGSTDLVRRDATGRKQWMVQADQIVYLHTDRAQFEGEVIDVDADPLPEVVLEVDYVTDVRRRKLTIYEDGGFPEVWALAPPESPVHVPGLTIHVHTGAGGYREASESVAIPGWRTQEIFQALTEDPMPEPASRALARVALAMGASEGTRPEDDPMMSALKRRWKAETGSEAYARMQSSLRANSRGRADSEDGREGFARGLREGRKQVRTQQCVAIVREVGAVLQSRGIRVGLEFADESVFFRELSAELLMTEAHACTSEADFLRRILQRAARNAQGHLPGHHRRARAHPARVARRMMPPTTCGAA